MQVHPKQLILPNKGHYQIVEKQNNRTVKIQRGGHCEDISITMITPFFNKEEMEYLVNLVKILIRDKENFGGN